MYYCNSLTTEQKSQLLTWSYKLKKEKRGKKSDKKDSEAANLKDSDIVFVIETVKKSPEKIVNRNRRLLLVRNLPPPSLHLIKIFKDLDAKWSEHFYHTSLGLLGHCFHPWCPDGHSGRRPEKVCPGCISEILRCRKLILGRDIG